MEVEEEKRHAESKVFLHDAEEERGLARARAATDERVVRSLNIPGARALLMSEERARLSNVEVFLGHPSLADRSAIEPPNQAIFERHRHGLLRRVTPGPGRFNAARSDHAGHLGRPYGQENESL
jgi:hypothetical protein